MAIQSYRAMESALSATGREGVFTYLNAGTQCLLVDPSGGFPARKYPVQIDLALWELLYLHKADDTYKKIQWSLEKPLSSEAVTAQYANLRTPFRDDAGRQILNFLLEPDNRHRMRRWLEEHVLFSSRQALDALARHTTANADTLLRAEARQSLLLATGADPLQRLSISETKRKVTDLRRILLSEALPPPVPCLESAGRTLGDITRAWGASAEVLSQWFRGLWLEDVILSCILEIHERCGLQDYTRGLESFIWGPLDASEVFESDILVMKGHRLFYLSVTTDDSNALCKSKLFEAYLRAQQLGGDHSMIGLASLYRHPERLQREVYDERHVHVRVFGPESLRDRDSLDSSLEDWFGSPR